ncbi:hypothetical protein V1517DRAFT_101390 [Lipomyces orientalis]|uniref:Uncharacterized protein n=1 Tax=Lipomyces orientalis TaxID=1233043 RepID=A0ACC3TYC9_9ASCO
MAPDYFKLALAIALVRTKPAHVSISDYRLRVLASVDPAEFWKTRYDDTIREVRDLKEQVDMLKTDIAKKRKVKNGNADCKSKTMRSSALADPATASPTLQSPVSASQNDIQPIEQINENVEHSTKHSSSADIVKPDSQPDSPHALYSNDFASETLRESARVLLMDGYNSASRIIKHIDSLEQHITPSDEDPQKVLTLPCAVKVFGFIILRLEQVSFRAGYVAEDGGPEEPSGSIERIKFQECLTSVLRSILRGIAVFSRRELYDTDDGHNNNKCLARASFDTLLGAYAEVLLSTAARSSGLRKGIIMLVLEHFLTILTNPHSLLFGLSTPSANIPKHPLVEVAATNTARRYLFLLQQTTPHETVSEYATIRYEIECVLFADDGVGETSLGAIGFRNVVRTYCLLRWLDERPLG